MTTMHRSNWPAFAATSFWLVGLAAWIHAGAVDAGDRIARESASGESKAHWAFIAPVRPALPESVRGAAAIDLLVDQRLAASGLVQSEPADRHTLLRRISYALVGLPPTYDETVAFQNDQSADAWADVVDRLLASRQFGERWGRHWLDIARYADTKGYVFEESREYPHAYTYRDWVVQALNDDRPYDVFIKQQIAADQLGDGDADSGNHLAAMGFLTLGRRFLNNPHDIIDDRIDVVTRGLMGLTVSCARCHDHKYDPIPTADYYSLYGVFASSSEPQDEPGPLRLIDKPSPVEPHVFERGNPHSPGAKTPRRFLTALAGPQSEAFAHGSGRLELAEAIANDRNPLTARVWVNRVWRYLFGAGLVDTPSDFGTRSDPPLQHELLDQLAVDFMEHGWSTKSLIRQIVLSNTYRQSSAAREDARQIDPTNRLFWRQNRLRLDFESLRDATLFVAGRLDLQVGGPAVKLTEQPFSTRRTLYGKIERQNLPMLYRTFDFASPDAHAPRRYETTVPMQALFLLNSPFVIEQAQALADRALTESPLGEPPITQDAAVGASSQQDADPREAIIALYRRTLARDPEAEELNAATAFLGEAAKRGADDASFDRWSQLAQALVMSNEFYFVD